MYIYIHSRARGLYSARGAGRDRRPPCGARYFDLTVF